MAKKALSRRTLSRPLIVVALMLTGSAAIRISEGVGPVMANSQAVLSGDGYEVASCTTEPELDLLQKSLLSREVELMEQAKTVVAREAAVRSTEEDLAKIRAELDAGQVALEQAEVDFARRVKQAEKASETDILQLIAVYEAMKPKDAAKVFEAMSPEFASGFLREMPTETAASILAGLSPDFAYSVSVLMAGHSVGMNASN